MFTEISGFAVVVSGVRVELLNGGNDLLDFASPELIFALIQPVLPFLIGVTEGPAG